MNNKEVEKYRKSTRILHWIHSGAFLLLFLTGLVQFIPALGLLGETSLTHSIHRLGATIFVAAPVVYFIIKPKAAGRGLKLAFTWGREDLGWLKAAPRYYLLGDAKDMPPQGIMNTGQKLWWLLMIVLGIILAVTGAGMLFAKTSAPPSALQRMVTVHDVCFVAIGAMFLLHVSLGIFHPAMNESWKAITGGKISAEYARTHHGRWYAEISNDKEDKA